MVRIVCDSAAAVSPELTALYGITVVPMELAVDGVAMSEDQLAPADVVARLGRGMQTSGPSPGAFSSALQIAADPEGVLVLTVGSLYSSTHASALAAARSHLDPTVPVRVVDSGTAAGAEALVVLAAAQAAAAGATLAQVEQRALLVRRRVRLVAAVERLSDLVRGGRVPASAARFGERMGMRVLFELRPQGLRPLRPVFSVEAAVDQLVGQWRQTVDPGADLHVVAMHALRPALAEALLDMVGREVKPATAMVGELGPVMLAHTGPGVFGLAWWWDRSRPAERERS